MNLVSPHEIILLIYFLPMAIALYRELKNSWSIAVINFFLGWTLIGWVVALAMAVSGTAARRT